MNAVVQIATPDTFEFEGQPIRIFRDGKSVTFAAIDLAKCAGYGAVGEMTRLLKPKHKGVQIVHTLGGRQQIATVTEAGLYRILTQRRGSDRTPADIMERIERFQDWVFEDVLPSIRKTGSYSLVPTLPPQAIAIENLFRDPGQLLALAAFHAQAALTAQAQAEAERVAHSETHQFLEDQVRLTQIEHRRAETTGRELVVAREVIAEQAPVVAAFQRFRNTGKAENLRTMARLLGAGHPDFFAWIQERGWIFREGGWLQAKAHLLKGKHPKFVQRLVRCIDEEDRWQTLVTPNGQFWLHDRWQARQRILALEAAAQAPVIEQDLFDGDDEG